MIKTVSLILPQRPEMRIVEDSQGCIKIETCVISGSMRFIGLDQIR